MRIKKTEGHAPPRSTDENEKFAVIIQTDVRRETQRARESPKQRGARSESLDCAGEKGMKI